MAEATEVVATEPVVEQTAEEKASAEELAGFEAAMNDTPLPKEEAPKEEAVVDETPVVEAEKTDPDPAPVVQQPELAAVTKEQLAELLQTANSVKELNAGLEKLRSDAFGKVGGLERLLKQAKEMVDSGLEVKLTDEDFAEVDTEVPMLTKPLQKLIEKVIKNAKVKVPSAQQIDVEALQNQFNEAVEKRVSEKVAEARTETEKQFEARLLTMQHPDWQKTVQDKEFHSWLEEEDKTQPGSKNRFLTSWDSQEIGGFLKRFGKHVEASKKPAAPAKVKPTPQVSTRTQRLLEAVPAKGASSATPKPKGPMTEEEAFEAAAV